MLGFRETAQSSTNIACWDSVDTNLNELPVALRFPQIHFSLERLSLLNPSLDRRNRLIAVLQLSRQALDID